jgi:hypothetical protein
MQRKHGSGVRREPEKSEGDASTVRSEAWLFAQAILGKPIPSVSSVRAAAQAKRDYLNFVAAIAPERKYLLDRETQAKSAAAADRKLLEWLAKISPRHEQQLQRELAAEAAAAEAQRRFEQYAEELIAQEAQWDPAKHPRLGHDPNAGWFASKGGTVSTIP